MSNFKKIFITIIFMLILLLIFANAKTFANNSSDLLKPVEYSEDYKKWLELSDEEKKNVLMPRMYDVPYVNTSTTNPLLKAQVLKATSVSEYNLKDIIPNNLAIRNQMATDSCWTFAGLSSLETNLALSNYKRGVNLSKVYDFSERHLEYSTSRYFLNDVENPLGYNRSVGDGGTILMVNSYLVNGYGAVPESEMPFENNENIIDFSEIQGKTVSSQVYDTVPFPNYNEQSEPYRTDIINQIKDHVQNYGSVYAGLHGNSSSIADFACFNNDTAAKYCNNSEEHKVDHAVSIIGWDDNYSVDNFAENARPSSNGAWIVRNSWGEDYGDNGIIYVSYEDVNICTNLSGIVKATDTVDYDYIYQYDELGQNYSLSFNNNNIMLGNIFNKQTSGTEYLNQILLYAPEQYTCKVYVNPNGTSMKKEDLQFVQLKSGESELLNVGYHTLEFAKSVKLNADSFAVVVQIQGTTDETSFALEAILPLTISSLYSTVSLEIGKCFVASGNDLSDCNWYDLGSLSSSGLGVLLPNSDSTIKAFTTTELNDGSLKNIEISTPPNKVNYFEGENFDPTGMVVKANYNSKTNPSVILDSSSYTITNGSNLQVGQTSVQITYEDMSVEQTINVEKNTVTNLTIKTPPTQTQYKEGQHFNPSGMVIEATFKDGTVKDVTDYTIENGYNLKADQTEVIISYGEMTVSQSIDVTPNPLLEITITQEPNKTKYITGQNFDKTGMIVTGLFQDNSTQEIIDYTIENGTNLVKGQTSVTITYEGKSVTQSITVEDKFIVSISIDTAPSKLTYIQNKETLELAGGILLVSYNDETTETIPLDSEEISITGFDNTKVGKQTLTITYQNKTTQLEIEIIEEERAKNSDFSNAKCNIKGATAYFYTDNPIDDYLLIDIEIYDIVRNLTNDKVEYYYYLSGNDKEENINGWAKISEEQNSDNKLEFTIDSRKLSNYEDIVDEDVVYLYIREVAVKGGDQSVSVSKSMQIEPTDKIEIYVDDNKVENINYGSSNYEDLTVAPGKLPQTGVKSIIGIFLVISIAGIIIFIRYKKLSKYIK